MSKVLKIQSEIILLISLLSLSFWGKTYAGEVSFYLYDSPNKSVAAVVNNSAEVVNRYNYDSFGEIEQSTEEVSNTHKYDAEQFDSETGLIYLRSRYYDPVVGRFVTKDPHPGFTYNPQANNPYPFCQNNPVNFIDPNGDTPQIVASIAGAIIGGVWGAGSTYVGDIVGILAGTKTKFSDANIYWANIAGGAVGGALTPWVGPVAASATGGVVSNSIKQGAACKNAWENGNHYNYSAGSLVTDTALSVVSSQFGRTMSPRGPGAPPTTFGTAFTGKIVQNAYKANNWNSSLDIFVDVTGIKSSYSSGYDALFGGFAQGFDNFLDLGSNISATPSWMQANFGGVS
ncbi:MAG: RHS repeat-associated core domain-containing protein, partial [Candidatus Omnitrophota bacterium]